MHDTTCAPALVDHSISVGAFGSGDAMARNMGRELEQTGNASS